MVCDVDRVNIRVYVHTDMLQPFTVCSLRSASMLAGVSSIPRVQILTSQAERHVGLLH